MLLSSGGRGLSYGHPAPGPAPRGEIARLLFHAAVARLPIRVRLPGGRQLGGGDADAPLMAVSDPGAFFARIGAGGLIGFGAVALLLPQRRRR